MIKTEPKDAYCRVSRDGMVLGEIQSTPGQVLVNKTFSDLRIECRKAGYADSLHFNRSEVAGAAIVSVFFFGAAGAQMERDAGAIRRYDDEVIIPLVRPGEAPKPLVVVEQARGPNGKQPRPALRATASEPIPPVQKAGGVAPPPPAPLVALAPSSLPPADSPVEKIVVADATSAVIPVSAPLDPYLVRRLENLKEIFDRKALTPAEYERKRATLMAGR